MLIVMISGWAGSGKDTAAAVLVALGFARFGFADELKDHVASTYGVPRGQMDTQEGKKQEWIPGETVRQLLIRVGEAERAIDQDVWVKRVARKAACLDRIVISDWRLPEEHASMCRHFPGARVLRIRIQRWARPALADRTETALDAEKHDYVVENNGDLSLYLRSLKRLFSAPPFLEPSHLC
jgi:hypothetical protein